MKMIWIVGASGHVGSALVRILDCMEYELILTDIDEVDITNEEQVTKYMNINRPDVVINCAGYTNPELCETNVDEAYKVNAVGVRNLAQAAESIQAKMIQISTDDVFDGNQNSPYNEFDPVHPHSIYGRSKYAGERFVTQLMTRYVIIRSSWVYGTGSDYVDRVLDCVGKQESLEVSDNRYAIPTSASELAKVIVQFIDNDHFGTYHAVCSGKPVSRYEYAKEILRVAGKSDKLKLIPVSYEKGIKPEYTVLDNMMLRISQLEQPMEWKAALKQYIDETGGIE